MDHDEISTLAGELKVNLNIVSAKIISLVKCFHFLVKILLETLNLLCHINLT